jgi:hypothetical protein
VLAKWAAVRPAAAKSGYKSCVRPSSTVDPNVRMTASSKPVIPTRQINEEYDAYPDHRAVATFH